MPENGSSGRLSELEARWREDRSPRVFLQLADELRRAGELARAVRVLEEGLTHNPNSISGHVALGRVLLESGEPLRAITVLERALERDPTQAVANKLLVEGWIRMGDAASARGRLDIYRILQDSDAEIEAMEHRIDVLERGEAPVLSDESADVSAEATPSEIAWPLPVAADTPAPPALSSDAETVFDLSPPAELPAIDLFAAARRAPLVSDIPVAAVAVRDSASRSSSEPFGVLYEPTDAARRIARYLEAQGVFARPPVAAPAAAKPFAPPIVFREATLELLAAELEAPTFEIEASDLAPAEPAFELFSTLGYGGEVDREPIEETLEEPLAELLAGRIDEPPSAELEPRFELVSESDAAGAPGAVAPEVAPAQALASSSTLAELYLRQGHLAEAEVEYRAVLAARPDDDVAHAGLGEVGRRRAAAAEETAVGFRRVRPGGGLTQRKVETLRAYLVRIQRSRARARVS